MLQNDKPIANPLVVLREEFDDWAILFDPDTGNAFGLNPTGVYLWKLLDGEHSLDDLLVRLRESADDVPDEVSDHVSEFVQELTNRGLAGREVEV
jgi:SynChlorMet cassette protein ScmD